MTDTDINDELLNTLRTEASQRHYSIASSHHSTDLVSTLSPDPDQTLYHAGEFLSLYDDQAFIDSLYNCLLGRPADHTSMENCIATLNSKTSRIQLLNQLSQSQEAEQNAVQITGMIWTQRLSRWHQRFPNIMRIFSGLATAISRLEQRHAIQVIQSKINHDLDRRIEALKSIKNDQQQCSFQLHQLEQHLAEMRIKLHAKERQARKQPELQHCSVSFEHDNTNSPTNSDDFQQFYLAFENRFRGSQADISAKLSQYLAYLPTPHTGTTAIVDLGCGRGEWLSIVKQAGYQEIGLDNNEDMIELCEQQGLNVKNTPLHAWLSQAPDNSIAGITGFHIAEHLPFPYLLELLQDSARALTPGGVLILETPNPENTQVGSHSFYHDPTHRNPLTPSLMQFVAEYIGLVSIQILRLSPLPTDQHLTSNTPESHFLNARFCCAQDYALIAYKPDSSLSTGSTS